MPKALAHAVLPSAVPPTDPPTHTRHGKARHPRPRAAPRAVELGRGAFRLSDAAADRFAIMVNIGYLAPAEEAKLVNFDFKRVRLNQLMPKERIIQLRAAISREVFLHDRLSTYIQRLV